MPGVSERAYVRTETPELLLAPWFYRFTAKDDEFAWRCARKRISDARGAGAVDRFRDDSEMSHYWGALGEVAACRFLGVRIADWACPTKRWNKPDVVSPTFGPFEVRAIPSQTRPYLKTKKNDSDDVPIMSIYLCVATSVAPKGMAIINGWIYPSEIREHGDMQDWGNRGAAAWMTPDMTILRTTFLPIGSSSRASAPIADAESSSKETSDDATGPGEPRSTSGSSAPAVAQVATPADLSDMPF